MPTEYIIFNGVKTFIEYDNLDKVKWNEIKDDPTKVPLVFVHGWTANRFRSYPVYEYFKKLGWPIVNYDLRGHGYSQKGMKGQYTMNNCADDLLSIFNDFLKDRFGYQQMSVFGHSMGGMVTVILSVMHPEIVYKQILASTGVKNLNGILRKIFFKRYLANFKNKYEAQYQKKKKSQVAMGVKYFPQWEDEKLLPDPDATVELLEEIIYGDFDAEQIRDLKMPTHIFIGEKDILAPIKNSKYIHERIKGSTLDILEGFHHNIGIEARDIFPQLMEKYLKS